MNTKPISKPILGIIFCFLFSLAPNYVIAGEEKVVSSLGISPSVQEIAVEPGQSYSAEFKVVNPTKSLSNLSYEIEITPYSVTNEQYDADFDTEQDFNQIVKWVTILKTSGMLEPGESENIPYRIDVPSNAPAGGQYAAFMVKIINPEQNAASKTVAIAASSRVASLLFASVAGETHTDGLVLQNHIANFIFDSPILVSSVVKNIGNVHISATYVIQVYPLFSDEEVYTNEEKPKVDRVIPNTQLYSELKWEESPALGIYKVRQTVSIGEEVSVNEKFVFVCPTWFFLALIAFFSFCILCIIYRIYIRRKLAKRAMSGHSEFQAN